MEFLSANLVKTGGFRDQISTKTHAAIAFKNVHLKAFFQRFILKVVRGYIVHLLFELQIGENLLDILHAENTHFDGVVSRAKKATRP